MLYAPGVRAAAGRDHLYDHSGAAREHVARRRVGFFDPAGCPDEHNTHRQFLHESGHALCNLFFLCALNFPLTPGYPQFLIQGGNLVLQISVGFLQSDRQAVEHSEGGLQIFPGTGACFHRGQIRHQIRHL